MNHTLKRIILIGAIIGSIASPTQSLAITGDDANALNGDSTYYVENEPALCALGGTLGPDSIEGHSLPAAHGGVGLEEAIDEQGRVASTGGRVSFYQNAALGQAYRDYYITMRWRYRKWNWDGTSVKGPEDVGFYTKAPRVVVVNPRTGKSITTVIMESGPAPWTGVDSGSNNNAKQGWANPQDGTPETYKGRVSGLPPVAFKALGATMRMSDGSGDDLQYSWDDNQQSIPGPNDATDAGDAEPPASCAGADVTTPIDGNYAKNTADLNCPASPNIKDGGVAEGWAGGKQYDIRLCVVHGFRVNVLVASRIDALISKAKSQGKNFGGGGFRTMDEQISLRTTNGCPDVYKAPASSCRTPTARPGYSNHQMGLAIDFTYNGSLIRSHGNGGFIWLSQNATDPAIGYKNLPSEPWHWSVNGN